MIKYLKSLYGHLMSFKKPFPYWSSAAYVATLSRSHWSVYFLVLLDNDLWLLHRSRVHVERNQKVQRLAGPGKRRNWSGGGLVGYDLSFISWPFWAVLKSVLTNLRVKGVVPRDPDGLRLLQSNAVSGDGENRYRWPTLVQQRKKNKLTTASLTTASLTACCRKLLYFSSVSVLINLCFPTGVLIQDDSRPYVWKPRLVLLPIATSQIDVILLPVLSRTRLLWTIYGAALIFVSLIKIVAKLTLKTRLGCICCNCSSML